MITKNKLLSLIEPHFYKDLKSESYKVESFQANKLLTYNRFDIAFKLLYLDFKNKNVDFAKEIYIEHIRAFSLGSFTEPGNEDKNNSEIFIKEFNKIFENIKKNGFDKNKTVIPLSSNGSISNGAHRIASAIYLNEEVHCVNLENDDNLYDYKFFYNRNVSSNVLDMATVKFIEYAHDTYIAFLWPIGIKKEHNIEKIIPNIIYKKTIKLDHNGAHNLLSQIYYGEEWLGSIEDNFIGVDAKLVECFKNFDEFNIVAFQAKNLNEVLEIKEKIRNYFNVGKHSVHITDTKDEAVRVARVVFNENALHMLNYAKPNKYMSTHNKIEKFKKFKEINKLSKDDILLDSSIVLSIYGLREARDIDFLYFDNDKIVDNEEINIHDEELKYYEKTKDELIYNPKNYFYFNDLKFISFNELYKMKKNRAEEKDINDCKMMEALLENNTLKQTINTLKQNIYYGKIKSRFLLLELLKKFRLYEIIKILYKAIKK